MSQNIKIKVTVAHQECYMCPTIISGKTSDGMAIYARYRWGVLSVRVDPRDPAPNCGVAGYWVLSKEIDPEELDGCMTYEELKSQTEDCVEWPDELSTKIDDDTDS